MRPRQRIRGESVPEHTPRGRTVRVDGQVLGLAVAGALQSALAAAGAQSYAGFMVASALAGLGKGVAATGKLSREGVETALEALRRYQGLLEDWNPTDIFVVATAAVREASDGKDFLRLVKAQTGLSVRVLTGE